MGRKARSRQLAGRSAASNAALVGARGQPTTDRGTAEDAVDTEALCVTHWFDSEPDGEPYSATIRFTGNRIGVRGKPGPRDTFVKNETVEGIVPGSGSVSITTWVYGLHPGEWTVTADLIRAPGRAGARRPSTGGRHAGSHTLPRAKWSWTRWALSTAPFAPIKTRWGPLVRLVGVPAVIPGTWSGLVATGVLVGAVVQATLLARANVGVAPALLVDLLALLSGLVVAKVWYVVMRPGRSWRQSIGEGWTVDGLLLAAPVAGVVALFALNLPIGTFLDASAPALFFGVAIGRLGCFFTGCCSGRCTRSRWGVWSSNRRVGARRIPTQLLESGAGLAIGGAGTLLVLSDGLGVPGATFVAAVAIYVIVRQLLLRLRAEPHSRIRAQVTAAAAAAVLVADLAVSLIGAG